MSKFAADQAVKNRAFITQNVPDGTTFEGAPAFARDEKSELFLLAINFLNEPTFYESKDERLTRLISLARSVSAAEPIWMSSFIPWLRDELNMRTAPIVLLAEYVQSGAPGAAHVIEQTLTRADEPAELLAYWMNFYGRKMPMRLKKGLARAASKLYTEYSYLKYRGTQNDVQMADVIEMVHPIPIAEWQSALYKYALDIRHDAPNAEANTAVLNMIWNRNMLNSMDNNMRRATIQHAEWPEHSKAAGVTWEWLSSWIPGGMDAEAWESVIPQMGYMALLRNLRNFTEAGVAETVKKSVADRIGDPAQVAKSRQFPIRFYTAFKNTPGLEWASALETALKLSVQNVPELKGNTLVLVDVSGSMSMGSSRASYNMADIASVFGAAFAIRNAPRAKLISFSTSTEVFDVSQHDSVLRKVQDIKGARNYGGGTNALQAIEHHKHGVDRILMVTDEQFHPGPRLDFDGPVYVFNIGGYSKGGVNTDDRKRYIIGGGLTDKAFEVVKALELYGHAEWQF